MTYIPSLNQEILDALPNDIKTLVCRVRGTRGGSSWVGDLNSDGNEFLENSFCARVELNNNFMIEISEDWERESEQLGLKQPTYDTVTEKELLDAGFVVYEKKTQEQIYFASKIPFIKTVPTKEISYIWPANAKESYKIWSERAWKRQQRKLIETQKKYREEEKANKISWYKKILKKIAFLFKTT